MSGKAKPKSRSKPKLWAVNIPRFSPPRFSPDDLLVGNLIEPIPPVEASEPFRLACVESVAAGETPPVEIFADWLDEHGYPKRALPDRGSSRESQSLSREMWYY